MSTVKRISIRELRKIVGRFNADTVKRLPIQVWDRTNFHAEAEQVTIAYNDAAKRYDVWIASPDENLVWRSLPTTKFSLLVSSIVLP